ncbi:MAG: hypothetical protein E4H26_08075 [Flavobacteriales bacterium]|nr:MAG: hypothetical protein E4H26_08075 [Flavobacteriales bacterium]
MKSNFYLKSLLGALLLSLLNLLYQTIFTDLVFQGPEGLSYTLLSHFLVVCVLGIYVLHSTLKGIRLALSVIVIYYIIGNFNLLIEAYIFNVTDRSKTLEEMLQGLFVALFFAPTFVYLLTAWKGQTPQMKFSGRSIFGWSWRIVIGMFLYLLFYLTAGMILQTTYPGLMDFYKDKIPPIDVMILTQFPRGLIFVTVAILMLRTSTLSLMKKAILIGLTYSILGAIAPLIPPNELMPSNIRLVHGFEVGISNFLYGILLSYLLGQKMAKPIAANTVLEQ